jgi:hypothetical protein
MTTRRLGWSARVEGCRGDGRHGRHGARVAGNGGHGGSTLEWPKSEGAKKEWMGKGRAL